MDLPEGARHIQGWQTKDLGCSMECIAIRSDGSLVNVNIRMEQKAGAPPSPEFMDRDYITWRDEWMERKEGPDKPVQFTGSVNFYSEDGDGTWWEFCAFIRDGKCFEIIQIEPVAA